MIELDVYTSIFKQTLCNLQEFCIVLETVFLAFMKTELFPLEEFMKAL